MADGIFGGVDLSALDEDTLIQLTAVVRERIKTAEADGYDRGVAAAALTAGNAERN